MNAPFQCWRDETGDLWVSGGPVVSLNAAGTSVTSVGGVISGIQQGIQQGQFVAAASRSGQKLAGGSGRNYLVSGGPADPLFPTDYFRPSEPDVWISPEYPDAYIERDAVTGDLSLNDGTNEVATASGAGLASGVAGAGTFPAHDFAYDSLDGVWKATTDSDTRISFYSGNGRLSDGSGFIVASRTGILDSPLDPTGVYVATTYGKDTYNGGAAWDYTVTLTGGGATMTATTYGEDTYNGGTPFTFDIEFEGDLTGQASSLAFDTGTAQAGSYSWTGWQQWTSDDDPDWIITIAGTGAGELSDGTDVVATRAANADKLYDTSGPWISTAYGDTNYGGTEDVTDASVSAGTLTEQSYSLGSVSGDVETWTGDDDPSLYVELDTTSGDAILYDGTESVAERLGGATTDIDGSYTATAYGEDTYNTGSTFTMTVATASAATGFNGTAVTNPKVSLEGYVYVTVEVDGSDEVTGVTGPFFAASLPANSATEYSFPLCHSDGAGVIEQIQIGPIIWRPI